MSCSWRESTNKHWHTYNDSIPLCPPALLASCRGKIINKRSLTFCCLTRWFVVRPQVVYFFHALISDFIIYLFYMLHAMTFVCRWHKQCSHFVLLLLSALEMHEFPCFIVFKFKHVVCTTNAQHKEYSKFQKFEVCICRPRDILIHMSFDDTEQMVLYLWFKFSPLMQSMRA